MRDVQTAQKQLHDTRITAREFTPRQQVLGRAPFPSTRAGWECLVLYRLMAGKLSVQVRCLPYALGGRAVGKIRASFVPPACCGILSLVDLRGVLELVEKVGLHSSQHLFPENKTGRTINSMEPINTFIKPYWLFLL